MPNHQSAIGIALVMAGLPLQLRSPHGSITVSGPHGPDCEYRVTGDPRGFSDLHRALIAAARGLAALRPPFPTSLDGD